MRGIIYLAYAYKQGARVAVLSDLVSRVRMELGDLPKQFDYTNTGDGQDKHFNLKTKPLDIASLYVTVNGSPIAYPSGYTVEEQHGIIHFTTAPALGSSVRIEGSNFRYFTDEDITKFVNTAVSQHTLNRTDSAGRQITLNSLPGVEEYPLVILSTIEALWALATDASFDINIIAPDGVTIPRDQRFNQLTNMVQQRWEQYKQLSSALNIGLWRIEMGTLRRVSRITNKLVPVYIPQEIDDSRRPERVYIQNDLNGHTPMPTTTGIYDIVLNQGDSWYALFDFPDDTNFSDLVFKAQIRTYPNSPSIWAEFTITVEDAPTKKLRLSLTNSKTKYIPRRAFWDLQGTSISDPDFRQTYIRGQVFLNEEVTQ